MPAAPRRPGLLLPLLALLLAAPPLRGQEEPLPPLRAQEDPLPPNPFAAFESWRLANGLRLWYGYLPGATVTSMAVVVPYGRDHDLPGREQTAHLLEHVLLSDRSGRAEADLARELAARGGQHNGFTGPSSTAFTLSIATDQAAYGIHWLHEVIAPRQLGDALVSRNRQPVAVEIQARRRPGPAGAAFRMLRHPRLVPPGFWRREFGLDAQEERGADQAASLDRIDAADLQRHFDTYYTPSEMTLVIVSGVPGAVLQPAIDESFGLILWRPPPPPGATPAVRARATQRYTWHTGASTRLTVGYRIPALDGRDQLRLSFIEDLLRHRLMERLRRGGDKAVYSVDVRTVLRGRSAFFAAVADLGPAHERMAREIVDEEIRRILRAAHDSVAFYADRDVLARRLRVDNASPVALRNWATDRFFRPGLHDEFPDVGEYYATVGADSIAAFAARVLTAEQRVATVARPLPLPLWLLALLGLLPVAGAARLYRVASLTPADMSQVRCIARIRPHPVAGAAAALLLAVVLLTAARLGAAAVHLAADRWLLGTDSFALRVALATLVVGLAAIAALALCGLFPRKVIVLGDEVRLKTRTYRSIRVPRASIRGATVISHRGSRRLRIPVLPPTRPAVFLELVDGSGYLLQVRDPAALARSVQRMLQAPAKQSVSTQLAMIRDGGESCGLHPLSS
jgi:predicted Zn-dependent peptidase